LVIPNLIEFNTESNQIVFFSGELPITNLFTRISYDLVRYEFVKFNLAEAVRVQLHSVLSGALVVIDLQW